MRHYPLLLNSLGQETWRAWTKSALVDLNQRTDSLLLNLDSLCPNYTILNRQDKPYASDDELETLGYIETDEYGDVFNATKLALHEGLLSFKESTRVFGLNERGALVDLPPTYVVIRISNENKPSSFLIMPTNNGTGSYYLSYTDNEKINFYFTEDIGAQFGYDTTLNINTYSQRYWYQNSNLGLSSFSDNRMVTSRTFLGTNTTSGSSEQWVKGKVLMHEALLKLDDDQYEEIIMDEIVSEGMTNVDKRLDYTYTIDISRTPLNDAIRQGVFIQLW